MTTDTPDNSEAKASPEEGMTEDIPPRSERRCVTCGEYHIAHRPEPNWAWQWSMRTEAFDMHPLRMESEADALRSRLSETQERMDRIREAVKNAYAAFNSIGRGMSDVRNSIGRAVTQRCIVEAAKLEALLSSEEPNRKEGSGL